MPKKRKIFTLDTNVILHDSSCINQFQEHDVVVPITVIEELDHFKKGNQIINYHAREFTRALDILDGDKLFNGGVQIQPPDSGKIIVRLEAKMHEDLAPYFGADKPDHRILNIAYHLSKEHKNRPVILVTKDVNLRMKARSVGLMAEDYTTDHVKDLSNLYAGCRCEEEIVSGEVVEMLYGETGGAPIALMAGRTFVPNEFLVLKNSRKSALATFDSAGQGLRRVDKTSVYGITPRNAEQTFAVDALLNRDISLVTITGKAGTGKTLLALAAALEVRRHYRQILLARPVVPLSNKDIGFLPGDIMSKIGPYMQPLYDNLNVIRGQFPENTDMNQRVQKMLEEDKLVIEPLAYIRGRSLVRLFVIVDEAQNLTPHEVKTIITRAGEGTKIVFTGDVFQIDHPYLDTYSNGLSHLIEKMQGQPLYAHINLRKGERSKLAELASDLL